MKQTSIGGPAKGAAGGQVTTNRKGSTMSTQTNNHPATGRPADRSARITAAAEALTDYRRFENGSAMPGDWATWAGRLAAALGSVLELTGPAAELATADHAFTRPGQVAPDLPAPDACVRCGLAVAAHLPGPGDILEPYCSACGEWVGLFFGLEDWQHFRGDGAPGGQRDLYEADHPAEVAWTVPAGRTLSPAALALLWAALTDAIEYRRPAGDCPDCESHPAGLCEPHADELDQADMFAALAKQLGADGDQ
jgi:hypothetical protein